MALIQSSAVSKTTGGASNVITLNGVVVGDLLIAKVSFAQLTNSNPPTISGWTAIENPAGQVFLAGTVWVGSAIFWKIAVSASETATIVPGASSTSAGLTAITSEFVTGLTSSPADVHTNSSGASATSGGSGTTGSTTNAGSLVVAAIGLADVAVTTHANCGISDPATTGYTSIGANQNTTDNSIAFQASYKYVTTSATQVASWSWTDASAYVGTIATFKLAPRVDTKPSAQSAAVGATATFTAAATTSGGTLTAQWYESTDEGETFSSIGGETSTTTYTTGTLSAADNGKIIKCTYTDDNGSTDTIAVRLWIKNLPITGKGRRL